VVLDNCEHVIDTAVESIDALLEKCSALKIVATSREALGMKGEQIFMVRSLSLPATANLDEMRRSEAVRLFVDHARLVLPDFAVDERNAAAIAEICRRLDGIALARSQTANSTSSAAMMRPAAPSTRSRCTIRSVIPGRPAPCRPRAAAQAREW